MTEFTVTAASVAPIAVLSAFIYGVTGFGGALIAIPLATQIVGLPKALAIFAIVDIVAALRIGLARPGLAVRAEWTRMIPMVCIGIVAGTLLLVRLPRETLMLVLGLFVLAVALSTLRQGVRVRVVGRAWAWPAGLAGGMTSAMFGVGGPPYAIYLSRRDLVPEVFRATLGLVSIVSILLRIVAFALGGLYADAWLLATGLAMIPFAWFGLSAGRRAAERFSRDLFMRAVGMLLLVAGVSLVARSLA